MKPRILVTSAVRKTGLPTALQLLAQGYRVRTCLRGEDRRSMTLKRASAQLQRPGIPGHIVVSGLVYGVREGRLREVITPSPLGPSGSAQSGNRRPIFAETR